MLEVQCCRFCSMENFAGRPAMLSCEVKRIPRDRSISRKCRSLCTGSGVSGSSRGIFLLGPAVQPVRGLFRPGQKRGNPAPRSLMRITMTAVSRAAVCGATGFMLLLTGYVMGQQSAPTDYKRVTEEVEAFDIDG